MIKNKRKGFTLTEMIIVIAVIIILAAILIPTFISLIRKSNMNSDLVLAKNLNIAVQEYKEENGIDDITEFEDAIVAVKLGGYVISTLNAKTKNCYFVWDNKNDQFILVEELDELVDGKNYQPLYYEIDNINDIPLPSLSDPNNKNTIDYFENGELKTENKGYWYFAATGFDKINHIIDHFGKKINYRLIVDSLADMEEALGTNSSEKQTIYVDGDQTLNFTQSNQLIVGGTGKSPNITLDLENGELLSRDEDGNTDVPIDILSGNLTIQNGKINGDGAGMGGTPNVIQVTGGSLTLDNMDIEAQTGAVHGAILAYSNEKVTITNSTITTPGIATYTCSGNITTYENCVVEAAGLFSIAGSGVVVVNSGTYKVKETVGYMWATKKSGVPHEAVAIINGGIFTSEKNFFTVFRSGTQNMYRVYIITGGVFNGDPFNEISEDQWNKYSGVVGVKVHAVDIAKGSEPIFYDKDNNVVTESERKANPSIVDKVVIMHIGSTKTNKSEKDFLEKYKEYIK